MLISLEYFLGYVIYNVYIHPLSKFPSPKSWAATYIPYALSLRKGNLIYRIEEIHRQHGDIVRLVPNQLSFIKGRAWADIYGWASEFSKGSYELQTVCLVSSSHLLVFFCLLFFWRIWKEGGRGEGHKVEIPNGTAHDR